ncbi:MAG: HlyD family secretion protein [Stellaceae bacterium]
MPTPEPDEGETTPADTTQERVRRKRLLIAAVAGALLIIGAIGLAWYWYTTWRWLESTDDAYTQADNTAIVPRVSGYISELLVTDNQRVKAGEVLVPIDPCDYQAAVDQAQADAKTGAGTVQRAQQPATDLRGKVAALKHNQAALAAAEKQIDVLRTQRAPAQAQATLKHNRAVLDQARLNLGYTVIKAPVDGAVGDRAARVGLYVQPGTQLMTIVPIGTGVYVVANFKETQIGRMFHGEAADFTVDAFPGAHLHGTLDSIAPGSGQVFVLLPPENATGNFTKIVQRVPVKILLDPTTVRCSIGYAPVFRSRRRSTPARHHRKAARRWFRLPTARHEGSGRRAPADQARLDRDLRCDPRRLYGSARHPDHQRIAQIHPRRPRRFAR